jgi:hypothetical protein
LITNEKERERFGNEPFPFFDYKEVFKMSNSTLVDYTRISPNRTSPRNHKIDTITIHCVVGQCSVETLGNIFAPTSRQASSNYGVGVDGRIGMYVEEKDRSWCSSNAANDNRAITIEVASDTTHPYAVNAKAYAALLDLVTDICRRNGIKKLVWSTSKNERVNHLNGCNMTVHRDYANKSCPGDYLYERHGAIAAEVNKRLGASAAEPETPSSGTGTLYEVQTGGYYKVQVGAFSKKANAEAMLAKLKAAGYSDAFITTGSGGTAAASVKVGSKVRLKQGAKTYDGKSLASFVYNRDHVVKEISGDRVVITYGGVVVAAVKLSDLTLV